MYFQTYFVIILISIVTSREIILSSGLGDWTHSELLNQYHTFKTYHEMKLIDISSMLIYRLNDDGNLDVYNTNDHIWNAESYQWSLKKNLGLKAIPCLYCDATIGMCANLSDRLDNLYKKKDKFIQTTIDRARQYQWDGYAVDFEPDQFVDPDKLTDFVLEWAGALNKYFKLLYIWIGAATPYNLDKLMNSDVVFRVITMDTYVTSYELFINAGSVPLTLIDNTTKLGFGLLTTRDDNQMLTEAEINRIVRWTKLTNTDNLSIWASIIPPTWYEALSQYH